MSQGTGHSFSKVGLAVLWHCAHPLADFVSYQMKEHMNALMAFVAWTGRCSSYSFREAAVWLSKGGVVLSWD